MFSRMKVSVRLATLAGSMIALIVLIGVLGFALDAFARWLHRRWVHA